MSTTSSYVVQIQYGNKKLRVLEAELDYPTGVNATYQSGKGRFFKTGKAAAWQKKAVADLRQQGFEPIPNRPYWCGIRYILKTVRMDVDGPAKAIIDAVSMALSASRENPGLDDTWVGTVEEHKLWVPHYDEQSLQLRVILAQISGRDRFREIEEALCGDDVLWAGIDFLTIDHPGWFTIWDS